jgi:hypothetical protein
MTSGRVMPTGVGAAFECLAAEVVGGQADLLEVGAGGAVVDDDHALAQQVEKVPSGPRSAPDGRLERRAVAAVVDGSQVGPYLNRLSDLLWTLARWVEGSSRTARS